MDDQFGYYVLDGNPQVILQDGTTSDFIKHEFFGNMFSGEGIVLEKIVAKKDTALFKINLNDVFDVLTNYKSTANRLINTTSKNLENHFYQKSKI